MTDLAGAFPPIPPGCGPVALLSSNEFSPAADEFDHAMLAASRGARVALIVAAAGADAPNAARHGIDHYRRFGADPFVVPVYERGHAERGMLGELDVLFLCGGSPRTLLRALRGSPLWDEAIERWQGGATLAGSSAGAMALCAHCTLPVPGARVPTRWSDGLGPLSGVAVAVHADERPREWLEQIAATASWPVVAMESDTGVILRAGEAPAIAGPRRVRVV
ncbi:MAG TPA: Type 1 glutamine amidotransferase-like domain-containing protein [Actinomycetota bacterium]|nr:Type 1 glutamine amidotransferase-like domain-containing protein [Actinomycetota bacterium]